MRGAIHTVDPVETNFKTHVRSPLDENYATFRNTNAGIFDDDETALYWSAVPIAEKCEMWRVAAEEVFLCAFFRRLSIAWRSTQESVRCQRYLTNAGQAVATA
jgi:hypothetical protein